MTSELRYNQALQDFTRRGETELADFGRTCIPAFQAFHRAWESHPELHNGHEATWTANAQYIVAQFAKKATVECRR